MAFLRSALHLLLLILITAPAGFLVCLAVVLPMRVRFQIIRLWRAAFMCFNRRVIGLGYTVLGRENIPQTPSVILSKHQSAWETVGLQEIFPDQVFVLKKSLLWIPFLGWAFAAIKMISIDRGAGKNALRQVLAQGAERLNAGYWVVIFPEGTRTTPGETRRFKNGGASLAHKAGVLTVPVAHNAGQFWAKNAFVKKPGLITVSIGPAIDPAGKTVEEINALAEAWINAEVLRLEMLRVAAKPVRTVENAED